MVPAWMLFCAVGLLVLALAGWGWTIRRSFGHALHMYDHGRTQENSRLRELHRAGKLSKRWSR